jgi:hypothetical protein
VESETILDQSLHRLRYLLPQSTFYSIHSTLSLEDRLLTLHFPVLFYELNVHTVPLTPSKKWLSKYRRFCSSSMVFNK